MIDNNIVEVVNIRIFVKSSEFLLRKYKNANIANVFGYYAGWANKGLYSYEAEETIAWRLGITVNTLRRCQEILEKDGLLQKLSNDNRRATYDKDKETTAWDVVPFAYEELDKKECIDNPMDDNDFRARKKNKAQRMQEWREKKFGNIIDELNSKEEELKRLQMELDKFKGL